MRLAFYKLHSRFSYFCFADRRFSRSPPLFEGFVHTYRNYCYRRLVTPAYTHGIEGQMLFAVRVHAALYATATGSGLRRHVFIASDRFQLSSSSLHLYIFTKLTLCPTTHIRYKHINDTRLLFQSR